MFVVKHRNISEELCKNTKTESAQAPSPEVHMVREGASRPVFMHLQAYGDVLTKVVSHLTYCAAVSHVPFSPLTATQYCVDNRGSCCQPKGRGIN